MALWDQGCAGALGAVPARAGIPAPFPLPPRRTSWAAALMETHLGRWVGVTPAVPLHGPTRTATKTRLQHGNRAWRMCHVPQRGPRCVPAVSVCPQGVRVSPRCPCVPEVSACPPGFCASLGSLCIPGMSMCEASTRPGHSRIQIPKSCRLGPRPQDPRGRDAAPRRHTRPPRHPRTLVTLRGDCRDTEPRGALTPPPSWAFGDKFQ